MLHRLIFCLLVITVVSVPDRAFSQTTSSQIWHEYMGNFSPGKNWNLEAAGTYSSNFGSPKWRAFDVQFTPEYSLNKNVDVMAAVLLSNTFQSATLSTFEARYSAGVRVHFTPEQRLLTRFLARFEQRNLEDRATGEWDHNTRSRFRAELVYPFNGSSMSQAKNLWYGLADAEAFVNFEKDLEERFANRFRFRAGVGYKLNRSLRFEFVYTRQASVNALDGEVETAENIFRFRIKQYFSKKAPRVSEGPGL